MKCFPVGTGVRKYEFFYGRKWVDGEVLIEPEECDDDDDDFYTVRYDDGDIEEYTSAELDRLVQWKSLDVGSKIRVQLRCGRNQVWKTGVIVKFRPHRQRGFQILLDEKDDADSGDRTTRNLRWVSFLQENFEQLPKIPDTSKTAKSAFPVATDLLQQKRQPLNLGDRLEIQGDEVGMFHPGTITKYKKGQYFFECDDGDKGWVDLRKTVYRHISSSDNITSNENLANHEVNITQCKKRQHLGNSAAPKEDNDVEVLENPDEDRYTLGKRRMLQQSKSKRHRRNARSGAESSTENVPLIDPVNISNVEKRRRIDHENLVDIAGPIDEDDVELLENPKKEGYPLGNRRMQELSKSKRHHRKARFEANSSADDVFLMDPLEEEEAFLDDIEIDDSGGNDGPQHNRRKNGTEETVTPKAAENRDESCLLCHASTMRKPRAAPCHHLFCKACIEKHIAINRYCPQCHFSPKDFHLSDEISSPMSFRPVECIDKFTGEVRNVFPSASCASATGGRSSMRIVDACQSKQRDEREHKGYYWRFYGSKDRILRAGEAVKDGVAVEQICLDTGKLIATYSSSRKAEDTTGISRSVIKRVLQRRGNADGGGYFWRYLGDSHGPWKDPPSPCSKAVEQLDIETGEVLREFESLCAAKKALGMKINSGGIRKTCTGERLSAYGFLWRWKGTQNLPRKPSWGKRVLLRRTSGGPVVREFATARTAAREFFIDFGAVCRWCREKAKEKGYIWSYAPESQRTPDENAKLVGKRIRVLRPATDEWTEGKLIAYNPVTGKHTIKYDSGDTVLVHLNDLEYDLKNDPGRKPVEKVSLETGEVLQIFPSVSTAAQDIGLKPDQISFISAVLHGKSGHCKGFFYRYQGSKALPRQRLNNRHAVEQLCLKTGRVLATFSSIQDAGRAVGITTPGISYCCNGRNRSKSAGGFGWRFARSELS